MATIDPVVVKIQADVADLKSGLQKAEAALKGLDGSVKDIDSTFSNFTTRMKQLGATIGVTFAASQVVSFFKQSVAASQEAEASQARLRNLLLNTNGATEAQIVALQNQAKALEKVGVVSADNITVAQSQLATFDLSAAAIGKLTPAILDYVTAEKGAAASSDDYKQMTNSLAQALQGNFTSLTKVGFVLDEATKKQISQGTEMERANALVKVLGSTYEGFNAKLRETSEGAMQVALNDFKNLQKEIGDGLKPIIDSFARFLSKVLIPALSNLVKFLKNNKDEIKAFAIALGIGATAWGVYTIAVNRAKIAQAALNLVQKANPIGILITAVALLAAGIVKLWKNSETFRNVIITVAKVALNAFASIIPMVARVYEAIAKIVTGPMRLFLGALSKLPGVGKFAKSGLDLINSGLDGISDLGDKAAKKAKELTKRLDEVASNAKKAGKELTVATEDSGFGEGRKGAGTPDAATTKKIDSLKKKLKDYYKDAKEIQADAQERIAEARERYNERIADAQERYNEQVLDANTRFAKRDVEIRKDNTKKILDITKTYTQKEFDLRKQLAEKLADLQKSADEKRLDLRRSAADKEASIMQQSVDRLRNAFATALGFNVKDEFEKGGGVTGLLESLRNKLLGAQSLQRNAANLAGQGYSQTFIEQVLSAGTEGGNQLAQALAGATPETTQEIQTLFTQLEEISNSGLNSLAATMNQGGKLATDELRKAYAQVAVDLQSSLAEVDKNLLEGMAEAQKNYEEAIAEAAKVRDEALLEQAQAFAEALAENQAQLAEALADAQKDLNKSMLEAQKAFDKAVDEIQKSMMKKLNDLASKIREVISLLAQLGINIGGGGTTGSSLLKADTSYSDSLAKSDLTNKFRQMERNFNGVNYNINNNITGVNLSRPEDTMNMVVGGIKYGTVVLTSGRTASLDEYAV